jgi:hypothetical protein
VDFLYDPADDLLIVPLPDLILGLAAALLGALPPALLMYPRPERFTLPLALRDLILVLEGRLVVFLVDLLTYPLPDLALGLRLAPEVLTGTYFLVPVPLPVDRVFPFNCLF